MPDDVVEGECSFGLVGRKLGKVRRRAGRGAVLAGSSPVCGDLTRQLALALADNAQQKAFVLGPAVEHAALPQLDKVAVSVRINGAEVAAADGSAVLGHPYNSIAWLTTKLAEFGEKVRRSRVGGESPTGLRWMGVAMMVGSLAALGWSVWKFALHGRLIP